jgi:hypothetical protein
VIVALTAPAAARASSSMFIGAVENAPLVTDPLEAKAKVDLAKLAGFGTLRISIFWARGRASTIPAPDLLRLQNAAAAAQLDGMRLVVSVSNFDSRDTPLSAQDRTEFGVFCVAIARAAPNVTDFIVGNEPNLNMFWMPQFSKPVYGYKTKKVEVRVRVKGKLTWKTVKKRVRYVKKAPRDLAAPAYERLLASTYDFLKSENPNINVIGVALSPRGSDNGFGKRPTHSPQTFIRDLGSAYRASRRAAPIMDAFAMHPYPERSSVPPSVAHPKSRTIGLADYTKLVETLKSAFGGTAQPGATLPIVYDEFGVQSAIPSAKKTIYTNLGTKVARDAVSETTQADYYRQALTMAYCQPNVVGMLLFHVSDESNANAWQSGLFYADDTPKASMKSVRATVESAENGTLSRCAGATSPTFLQTVTLPDKGTVAADNTSWSGDLTCTKWCTYLARIEEFPSGQPVVTLQADGSPHTIVPVVFPSNPLPPGTYRMVLRIWAYGRIGTAVVRYGTPFTVAPPPPATG